MDSLKTLMEKNQYELVIKLTENSVDSISLFYRLSAFIAVGKNQEALSLIKSKRDILQNKLNLLVKFHIEILCLMNRFDEAYEELKYYENLPYESQEVEEVLRAMPAYIRNAEKNSYGPKRHSEDDIRVRLLSKNEEDVLAALDEIKSLPIDDYLLNILNIVRSHPRQVVRTFALLLLVHSHFDKKVMFLHHKDLIEVNPSLLPEPFVVPGLAKMEDVSFAMQKEYRDPTVAQNALQLLASYLLYIYPDPLKLSKEETLLIFGYLSKKLLQIDTSDLEATCVEKGFDFNQINEKIKQIEEDLNDF